MKLIETGFKGLVIIEPKVMGDARGYFFEAYNSRILGELGLPCDFVQRLHYISFTGKL